MDSEKLLKLQNQASMAYEAYMALSFDEAVMLIDEYVRNVPEDLNAHLVYGDYLICAGEYKKGFSEYCEFYAKGGERKQFLEHALRSVIIVNDKLHNSLLISDEEFLSEAKKLSPLLNCDEARGHLSDIIADWNLHRSGFPKRTEVYREMFKYLENRSDIVFAIAPVMFFDAGYPPYGVGVLSHYLSEKGKKPCIADLNLALRNAAASKSAYLWNQDSNELWKDPFKFKTQIEVYFKNDFEFLANLIAKANTDVIGFGSFHINRKSVSIIIQKIKKINRDAFIILGGPDCFYPNQCFHRFKSVLGSIDGFVVGEGERIILNLLNNINDKFALNSIKGFLPSTAQANDFVKEEPLPKDELSGFPKFSPDYIASVPRPTKRLIATSRGCVNHCDFCYDRKAWQRFRLREISDIVDEMKYNINIHSLNDFFLVDSATNASPEYLSKLCDNIISEGINVTIGTSIMVHEKMDEALYAKMFGAGFRRLFFGIESGSKKVLASMGKRGGAEGAAMNLLWSKQAGIENFVFIIVGHPSEGEFEFEETVQFLKENMSNIDRIEMVNTCFILQETSLAEKMAESGICIPNGWAEIGSWTLGDNNLFERLRRKEIISKLDKSAGVLKHTGELSVKKKVAGFLKDKIRKIIK